jgi:hypothetical protein
LDEGFGGEEHQNNDGDQQDHSGVDGQINTVWGPEDRQVSVVEHEQ